MVAHVVQRCKATARNKQTVVDTATHPKTAQCVDRKLQEQPANPAQPTHGKPRVQPAHRQAEIGDKFVKTTRKNKNFGIA